jgi:hypothetical protein
LRRESRRLTAAGHEWRVSSVADSAERLLERGILANGNVGNAGDLLLDQVVGGKDAVVAEIRLGNAEQLAVCFAVGTDEKRVDVVVSQVGAKVGRNGSQERGGAVASIGSVVVVGRDGDGGVGSAVRVGAARVSCVLYISDGQLTSSSKQPLWPMGRDRESRRPYRW